MKLKQKTPNQGFTNQVHIKNHITEHQLYHRFPMLNAPSTLQLLTFDNAISNNNVDHDDYDDDITLHLLKTEV